MGKASKQKGIINITCANSKWQLSGNSLSYFQVFSGKFMKNQLKSEDFMGL